MALRRNALTSVALLTLATAGLSVAQPVAFVELKAVGPFADPHEIEVDVGSGAQLVLEATNVQNLAAFQFNIGVSGPASLSLVSGASWWEGQPNVDPNELAWQDLTQSYMLLGLTGFQGPPWSHSTAGPATLAILEFTCEGVGEVVVDCFELDPVMAMADAQTAEPLGMLEVTDFSKGTVTIDQIPVQEAWDLAYAVAAGQEALGQILGPGQGTYDDGTLIELVAQATDPYYMFLRWEERTGAGVPGDPALAQLSFAIHSELDLVAQFVLIPEPATLALLGVGIAAAAIRRRHWGDRFSPSQAIWWFDRETDRGCD